MYIIEFIVNYWKKKYHTEPPRKLPQLESQPYPVYDYSEDEYEKCEHIFMPVDSTGTVLACTKCGFVKKKDEIKTSENNNPFEL